jgi:hypothetical protein
LTATSDRLALHFCQNAGVSATTSEHTLGWRNQTYSILQSRSTFIGLQVLDLLTTLAAFHVGAFEINPLVARLTVLFGRVGGVLSSKVIAVLIALGIRRRLWMVNVFYTAVVCWNVIVLLLLSAGGH